MRIELVKKSVDKLELGMFVSKLDRPWLETPFLIQGFPIRTVKDINALKNYCSHVYIDVEKNINHDQDKKISIRASSKSFILTQSHKQNFVEKFNTSTTIQKDKLTFTEELPKAQITLESSNNLVRDVIVRLKTDKKINLASLEETSKSLLESVSRNSDAITWLCLMKYKDDYIYRHSVSSSIYAFLLGKHLGFDLYELQMIGLGAMLLDIGKTKIPDKILNKEGRLTKTEMAVMRKHVEYGLKILDKGKQINPIVKTMVENHHERHDGSGYPNNLAGDSIPIYGKIAGIVDSFDAMTSNRPYARQLSTYDCLRTLTKYSNKLFQKEVVEQFIQAIGFFPTGTLVELNDGSVGVVVRQNSKSKLKPDIIILLDSEKKLKEEFTTINLEKKKSIWINKGLEPGSYDIDPTEFFLSKPSCE